MTIDAAMPASGVRILRSPHGSPAARARSTDGRVIFAIGDIHGCYRQLSALLEAIVADLATLASAAPPLLVFCGDYVDRGPETSNVLTALIWLARHPALDVVFLRGNHEEMLLGFLEQPGESLAWLRRDGARTLMSYGVAVAESDSDTLEEDCVALRDQLLDQMPASHLDFLRALPIRRVCGDYVFVHAGLRPGVSLARQEDEDCLWIGKEFLRSDHRFEKVVVHGHSWNSDAPVVTANRIGIDTGAYATGVLTAVRLDGSSIAFIQARVPAAESSDVRPRPLEDGRGES
ncbi:metallophosphoesterase family protein [Sphingomonas sp. CARO-RG-8B-R24-01]|uniref:metallophosphoesterase family protein n=1 Tax=Sphingomonas sp. CARO-RG-8B-R24-01 TaxID=2914831 RepID=UPI001F56C8EF